MICFGFMGAMVTLSLSAQNVDQQSETVEEAIKQSKVPGAAEAADAALKWLKVLDQGDYGKSWDDSSKLFQATVSRNEWVELQQTTRKPLGKMTNRHVTDERVASNPKGLPVGNYMVLFYNTDFANRKNAHELVTLIQESDGNWRVLTYHVD